MSALKFWLMKEVAGLLAFLAVAFAIFAAFGLWYAYAAFCDWQSNRRRAAARRTREGERDNG